MIERLNYDIIYIENMSLFNDLKIILLTFEILFKGRECDENKDKRRKNKDKKEKDKDKNEAKSQELKAKVNSRPGTLTSLTSLTSITS